MIPQGQKWRISEHKRPAARSSVHPAGMLAGMLAAVGQLDIRDVHLAFSSNFMRDVVARLDLLGSGPCIDLQR